VIEEEFIINEGERTPFIDSPSAFDNG